MKRAAYTYKTQRFAPMYIPPGGKRRYVRTDDQRHVLVIDIESSEIIDIIDVHQSW